MKINNCKCGNVATVQTDGARWISCSRCGRIAAVPDDDNEGTKSSALWNEHNPEPEPVAVDCVCGGRPFQYPPTQHRPYHVVYCAGNGLVEHFSNVTIFRPTKAEAVKVWNRVMAVLKEVAK